MALPFGEPTQSTAVVKCIEVVGMGAGISLWKCKHARLSEYIAQVRTTVLALPNEAFEFRRKLTARSRELWR